VWVVSINNPSSGGEERAGGMRDHSIDWLTEGEAIRFQSQPLGQGAQDCWRAEACRADPLLQE
jgi:hypothetical protein